MPRLMKNGEFAAFCRTTKDTLIHYDRTGLLKPARVTAAGYRLYRPEQFFLFTVITTLQQADMPLADIRRLVEEKNAPGVIASVRERAAAMQDKIRRLSDAERQLRDLADEAEVVLAMPEGEILEETRPARRLRVFLLQSAADWTDEATAEIYADCIDWDRRQGRTVQPPAGELLCAEDLDRGLLRPRAVCTRWNGDGQEKAPAGGPEVRLLPAGRWAVCHRRICGAEVTEAVRSFLDGMRSRRLAGEGDLYLTDDFNYLFPGDDPERFDVVLSRKIREQEAPRAQSSPNPF